MAPSPKAQLLLPSSRGLVAYDVLEDAVFLGPAERGGLTGAPQPFPRAVAVLTRAGEGWVARALPGESAPTVNGQPAGERALGDGDRIALGEHVLVFHGDAAPSAAPAPPASEAPSRRAARRQAPILRMHPGLKVLAFLGSALLLVGLARAVGHLTSLRSSEQVRVQVPAPPEVPSHAEAPLQRSAREYEEVVALERTSGGDLELVLGRYRDFVKRHPESPDALRAAARIHELMEVWGQTSLAALDEELKRLKEAGRFESAFAALRRFERTFGATASGQDVDARRRELEREARAALDALLAQVGPMVTTDPRGAHRALLGSDLELPPDLAAEVTALMERAVQLMRSQGRPAPRPEAPTPAPREPTPAPVPEAAPPTVPEGRDGEAEAERQWRSAYASLKAGRYAEALEGYTLLVQRYGATALCRKHEHDIVAGRRAAQAGANGPTALLSIPATVKRGVIEVEYVFDDARLVEQDFDVEKPFPSPWPERVEPGQGVVRMSGASGLFHKLVWSTDVRLEAEVTADIARDFGVFAVEDADDFRAVMFNIGNTQFALKKGDAARVDPGHLLWFMGKGAWADADSDAIGYIKIAERKKVELENGDRLKLEFIRDDDDCEGAFQGKRDGVSLKGKVKGDDGRGMGPGRLGLFTNTGAIVIHRLKITGKVDEAWFERRVKELVALTAGPR